MVKGILLGFGIGLLIAFFDYWTYVRKFPPVVLFKMSIGFRALIIYGNIIIGVLAIGLTRHRYILLPDMKDKSLNDDTCLLVMVFFFGIVKILFLIIPGIKAPKSMWKK